MTVRFNSPRVAAFDANGNPRSGAKLYFYEPGTTTAKDVYSDSTRETPISQPVLSTSAGLWPTIFMDGSTYRVICKDSADVTIWDEDNFDPGLAAGFGVDSVVGLAQGGTGANNAAAARSNLGAASSSALTTVQDDVTELQTQVATGLNASDEFGALASKDVVAAADHETGTVTCIQRVRHTTVVDSTITTTTPAGDTSKPQITEGDQVFTKSFTPLSATSTIKITVFITADGAENVRLVMGLFKDSGSDAIAADSFAFAVDTGANQGFLIYEGSSGSTDARTYSVRCGVSSVTTPVVTINGATATLGGLRVSYLLIEELATA